MAEFQKVVKEKERMCDKYLCASCPLGKTNNKYCSGWIVANPKQAESIIMGWAAEHPIKTNRMRFEEVFGCSIVTHEIHEAIPGNVKILNASDEEFEDWLNAEYNGER